MRAPVVARKQTATRRAVLVMAAGVTLYFFVVGDRSRIGWLLLVLSLTVLAYLFRREPFDKLHPRSKEVALKEALFALGFTALLMFALGSFSKPDDPLEPLRMATTMGPAWAVVTYRASRGYPQGFWRLSATLLAVGLPITTIWIVASIISGQWG